MDTKFRIVVPVYNAEKYVQRCILSIANQTYQNYSCIIVDDASLDQTNRRITEVINNLPKDIATKFKLIKRSHNCGALENIVMSVDKIAEDLEDVIVLVDGDDNLFSVDTLSYVNEVYKNQPELLLTWGSYCNSHDNSLGLCRELPCDIKDYRKKGHWVTSHLRTIRYKIWRHINYEDLKDNQGKYYSMSWDLAIMIPLLEMAGKKRVKFISKVLYNYNTENSISDHKKDLSKQIAMANEIRNKQSYKLLDLY